MTRRNKTITLIASLAASLAGVTAAAVLVSSCDDGTSRGEVVARALDASTVSLTDAIVRVEAARTGGIVIEVELEVGDDHDEPEQDNAIEDESRRGAGPHFEVEQFVDGAVMETVIDAVSGRLVRAQIDPEDLAAGQVVAAVLSHAGVDMIEAVNRAEQHVSGRAFAVEVDAEEGAYEVAVVVGTRIWEVEVAIADGTVLEAEPDEDDEDDEDDDDEDEDEADEQD